VTATNRRVAAVDSCSLHAGFDFGFPHTSKHTLTSPLLSSRESKRKGKEKKGEGLEVVPGPTTSVKYQSGEG